MRKIPAGTWFGPFEGKLVRRSQSFEGQLSEFMWEVSVLTDMLLVFMKFLQSSETMLVMDKYSVIKTLQSNTLNHAFGRSHYPKKASALDFKDAATRDLVIAM